MTLGEVEFFINFFSFLKKTCDEKRLPCCPYCLNARPLSPNIPVHVTQEDIALLEDSGETYVGHCCECDGFFKLDDHGDLEAFILPSLCHKTTSFLSPIKPTQKIAPIIARKDNVRELCLDCHRNQRLKAELLRDFSSRNDNDGEWLSYEQSLDHKYALCSTCELSVAKKLEKQSSYLQLGFHAKNRNLTPNISRAYRISILHESIFFFSLCIPYQPSLKKILENTFSENYYFADVSSCLSALALPVLYNIDNYVIYFSLFLVAFVFQSFLTLKFTQIPKLLRFALVIFLWTRYYFLCIHIQSQRDHALPISFLYFDIFSWILLLRPYFLLYLFEKAKAQRKEFRHSFKNEFRSGPHQSPVLTRNTESYDCFSGQKYISNECFLNKPGLSMHIKQRSPRFNYSFERSFVDENGLWVASPFSSTSSLTELTNSKNNPQQLEAINSFSGISSNSTKGLFMNSLKVSSPFTKLPTSRTSIFDTTPKIGDNSKISAVGGLRLSPSILEAPSLGLEESFANFKIGDESDHHRKISFLKLILLFTFLGLFAGFFVFLYIYFFDTFIYWASFLPEISCYFRDLEH